MGFTDLNNGGGPSDPTTSGYGPVPTPIYRVLDTDGDGTGTTNAIGNYSAGAGEIFFIQPAPGEIFRIERMLVYLRGKKGDIKLDRYGKDSALTTGIHVRTQNDVGTITDLTNGDPVKRFGGWMKVCFDVAAPGVENVDYADDNIFGARWTFSRAGYPIRLVGDNNERLEVVLNDDFTGREIYEHKFKVQGYIEETT